MFVNFLISFQFITFININSGVISELSKYLGYIHGFIVGYYNVRVVLVIALRDCIV